jgi:predicted DNA-binding ribbon-helix-helix protein
MGAAAMTLSARPRKHSFTIRGHRTSISLETAFWEALREIAAGDGVSLAAAVSRIDAERGDTNLSSAVRLRVLAYYRAKAHEASTRQP